MITRIEVYSKISDARAKIRKKRLQELGFGSKIKNLFLADVYSLEINSPLKNLTAIASILTNPLTQTVNLSDPAYFSWAFEIGYMPGVTDNIAITAKEAIEDFRKKKFSKGENIYSSQITFIDGQLTLDEIKKLSQNFYNPLIETISIKSRVEYLENGGMDLSVPKVNLKAKSSVLEVDLAVADKTLADIGKNGIRDIQGKPRGPLALDLPSMKTIREYFRKIGRKPTDIELESLAQTWSEHCKHTIFGSQIDELEKGLFKTFIKGATEKILKKKPKFAASVFTDNSGAIHFDSKFLVTHKVETHNSPSALDPFGGSLTGIVGVNRDTIGFGLGALPIANFYGFCVADPDCDVPLYKGRGLTQKMLSSRRILEGIIAGVNAGGNQSGIPTPLGFLYFNERYRGKPLVFVGTIGIIPQKIKGRLSTAKSARRGDYIVMVGGRVGKDGIHGATFSSEGMDAGSPVSAVQIGNPIIQKKFSDALVKEARDQLLYHSITDNGAGGLSCSVAEMARQSDGCLVELEKVPLKYSGLEPWEIWVSESQERMTLAVPPAKWHILNKLMTRRAVEATIIGRFTSSGKCVVKYRNKTIMDVDLDFLHEGYPRKILKTKQPVNIASKKFNLNGRKHSDYLLDLLKDPSITGFEFISSQYDHIVQANLVVGPLIGRGRLNGETAVIRPLLDSERGIITSFGLYPDFSESDSYRMAACSIDTAIRNVVAAGADPGRIALLDNFCWCSPSDPERLYQLKCAAQACHDYALSYQTPFISGKDSLYNDFQGFDQNGRKVRISIPPTLLITSLGIIDNVYSAVTADFKKPGDLLYLLGETDSQTVPSVNALENMKIYRLLHKAIQKRIVASAIPLNKGGLAVGLAKGAMAGKLGVKADLSEIKGNVNKAQTAFFSESMGRIVVAIAAENKLIFENIFKGERPTPVGVVTEDKIISLNYKNNRIKTTVDLALAAYRRKFADY